MNEEFQPHDTNDDDFMRIDGKYAIKTPQFSVTTKPRSRSPDFESPIIKPYLGPELHTISHRVCNAQGKMVSRKSTIEDSVDENIVDDDIPEGISDIFPIQEEIAQKNSYIQPLKNKIKKPKRKPITAEDIQQAEQAVPIIEEEEEEEEEVEEEVEEEEEEEVVDEPETNFFYDIITSFKDVKQDVKQEVKQRLVQSEKGLSDIFNINKSYQNDFQVEEENEPSSVIEEEIHEDEVDEVARVVVPVSRVSRTPQSSRARVVKKSIVAIIPNKKSKIKCVCPQPICPVMTVENRDDSIKHYIGIVGVLVLIAILLIVIYNNKK